MTKIAALLGVATIAVAACAPARPPIETPQRASSKPAPVASKPARCDAGDARACFELAKEVLEKDGEVTQHARARERAERACKTGHQGACVLLGRSLATLEGAAHRDRALSLLSRMCEGKSAEGCEALGDLLANDEGGDKKRAKELYAGACESGRATACNALGVAIVDRWDGSGSYALAAPWFQRACDGGSGMGCFNLAAAAPATSEAAAPETAARLYAQGCAAKAGRACAMLGVLYAHGTGLPRDDGEAARRFTIACELHDSLGCSWLGVFQRDGRGVPRDQGKALVTFGSACDGGDAEGCENLGFAYQRGQGTPKDDAHARTLFVRACREGARAACGVLVRQGADGKRVVDEACKKDMPVACSVLGYTALYSAKGDAAPQQRALEYLARACELGEGDACSSAIGVLEKLRPDPARVLSLATRGCDLEIDSACTELASAHERGRGTPRDASKAFEIAQRACNANLIASCELLADFHSKGVGTKVDAESAAGLYDKCCDAELPTACKKLSGMYLTGRGVARDAAKAREYARTAKDLEGLD